MVTHSHCGAACYLLVKEHGALDRTGARRRRLLGDSVPRIGLLGLLYGRNRWKRRHGYAGRYAFDVLRRVHVQWGACLLHRCEELEWTGLWNSVLLPFAVALIATNFRFAWLARRLATRAAWC